MAKIVSSVSGLALVGTVADYPCRIALCLSAFPKTIKRDIESGKFGRM